MVLPQTLPIPTETAIASYSYTDIAEGTGVSIFYLANEADSAGNDYFLTPQSSVKSRNITIDTIVPQSASAISVWSQDFDVTFNLPKIIDGNCIVNLFTSNVSNQTDNEALYFIFTLKKVSGANVTTIGTIQTDSDNVGNGAGTDEETTFSSIISATRTHFKQGDILRLNVDAWAALGIGAGTNTLKVGADPANRAVGSYTGQSRIYVAFDLDL